MNLTMPVPHEGRERYLREQRDEARAERDALAAKVERLRALVRLLYPDEMTPTAKRVFDRILDTPEGKWQPGDPLPEPPQPTVEIGGQVITQAQFDAARYPFLSDDPGPTTAGDAMEVNADTPEGEK